MLGTTAARVSLENLLVFGTTAARVSLENLLVFGTAAARQRGAAATHRRASPGSGPAARLVRRALPESNMNEKWAAVLPRQYSRDGPAQKRVASNSL